MKTNSRQPKRLTEAKTARTAKRKGDSRAAYGSVRLPAGPGMWLWSEHAEPVEVWVLGWYDDTPEEAADWSLDDLRFEIDGQRYVPIELSGTWTKVKAPNDPDQRHAEPPTI